MQVLVVGSVALDSVETPFASRENVLGGSASYFSLVSSMLVDVRLVAVVGDDFPEEHMALLRSRGNVDLTGLQRRPGRTFRWKGRYLQNMVGRETLDTQLNVFESFDPDLPASYRDSTHVFLANIDPDLQLKVLDQVHRPRLVALDTMNFWITGKAEALRRVLARADVLLINDEELALLSGEHNLIKGAAVVRAMGPGTLVVKRGDAGALLFDANGVFCVPAFPIGQVVDPTGAGDTFAGGFVSYLTWRQTMTPAALRQAMVYGSVVASFCVEDFSLDRLRTLTLSDVQQRCTAFAELVRFEPITL